MRKFSIIALLLLASTSGWAQTEKVKLNNFDLSLNFLAHGEICAGGLPRPAEKSTPIGNNSSFILGRTRIIMDYQRSGLQAHAVIQNKTVWGSKGNQALNLYEGWVKMSARNGLFAQVGRIALSYDDERIIGTNDFATAALSHDVLRAGYEGHGHKVHAILGYNQNAERVYANTYYVDGAQYYKTMQTVWYHYDVPTFPLGVSLLFMNMGIQAGKEDDNYNPPSVQYQQMWGGYFKYSPKYLTLEGAYYRQTGQQVDMYKQHGPIRAWMASGKATIQPTDKYGFILGYDFLSGDDYVPVTYDGWGLVHHDVDKGFSPIYGSRTEFYGILDFFYESAYVHGFTPGLQNAYVSVFGNPIKNLNCKATYHYLATATKLQDFDRTLGHSIELEASYQFTKDISLTASYTYMKGTDTMAILKKEDAGKHAHWGWFSLVISPTLFTSKW